MTPTPKDLENWAKENESLAETVCLAKAFAATEKERVDAYAEALFATYEFFNDLDGSSEPLTTYHDLYLSEDEGGTMKFYNELSELHRANGWTGDFDHCPALVAADLANQAERALLESLGELFGVDFAGSYGELREKALDLAMKTALAGSTKTAADLLKGL